MPALRASAHRTQVEPLRLDAFQQAAIDALDAGHSVLVAAPTGSGKTVVADHAVDRALARGRKAFYTTPLKALSNQKHRDLAERLGAERVGLLTGDRTVNAGAPVVVMTTEVLRAMLHEGAELLANLDAVILDEFHYFQDPERGPVWEEVVIHAPREVALVCLSATVSDVDTLASWMSETHGHTVAVIEHRRPVELQHLYAVGTLDKTGPILVPVHVDGAPNPVAELLDGTRRREQRGEGLRVRSRGRAVTPERSDLLRVLHERSLLPALWFVLSRAGCEAAVAALLAGGVRLNDHWEGVEATRLADESLGWLDARDLRATGYAAWLAGLEAGIASHHAGLLPGQREVVERAFAEGLVKVAFATETLALGVNLPARSVVIDRVVRSENGDRRTIGSDAFAQLAGRAGRRGIDTTGYVVVPWAQDVPFQQVAAMTTGRSSPLRSHFRPTAPMVANLVRRHDRAGARARLDMSLASFLARREADRIRGELGEAASQLTAWKGRQAPSPPYSGPPPEAPLPVGRQHVPPTDPPPRSAALVALRPGDVIVDPGREALGRVVVVAAPRKRRGIVAVDCVRSDIRRVVLTERDFRQPPVVVGRVLLPEWAPNERGHARAAADALNAAELTLQEAATGRSGERAVEESEPVAAFIDVRIDAKHVARLERDVERLERALAPLEEGHWPEMAAMLGLLESLGHVDASPNQSARGGWALTSSGRVLRRLFHECGLLVAECLRAGLFDGLDAAEFASLASCFTATTALPPAPAAFPTSRLRDRWLGVCELARQLQRAEEEAGVVSTPSPDPRLALPIYRWASGCTLSDALERTGAVAGDLVREVKQVAELLHQVRTAADDPIASVAAAACAALMRDAVVAGDA